MLKPRCKFANSPNKLYDVTNVMCDLYCWYQLYEKPSRNDEILIRFIQKWWNFYVIIRHGKGKNPCTRDNTIKLIAHSSIYRFWRLKKYNTVPVTNSKLNKNLLPATRAYIRKLK